MNKTEHIPLNTIKISQKAINKVKEFAKRDSLEKYGLKVAVQGGGCSGLQYMLEIVDGPDTNRIYSELNINLKTTNIYSKESLCFSCWNLFRLY